MSASPEQTSSVRRALSQQHGGPTVLRILLGTHLRRLREAAGVSREAAGDAIRASHAKISRLELGRVGYKDRDVSDLLTLYGVTDEQERSEFLALARRASSAGWWQKYGDVLPGWFETLLGLEEAAGLIRNYQVQFVPGLLQTADYARAVTLLANAGAPEHEIQRKVDVRLRRQQVLDRPDAPKLWVVVDEAALRRPLGGADVMRGQVSHLLEMGNRKNITIQIAPFDIGGLAAAGGPIHIMRFTEPDLPDVVYLEQLTSALYLDKPDEVENYKLVMDRLCATAETHAGSMRILERLADEF